MGEPRSSLRRRRLAFSGALVLALLGVAFLVWSITQHQDARAALTDARTELARGRANTSSDAKQLKGALASVETVRAQLGALVKGVPELATLDEKDADAVKAAIAAGVAGKLSDYNAAVDQRTSLDPQHDTALEQLRQQANAVITALDPLG